MSRQIAVDQNVCGGDGGNPGLTAGADFHFRGPRLFKLGALLEGLRRLMPFGGANLLGVRRIFTQISPSLPEKKLQKMTSKKITSVFYSGRHFTTVFVQISPNLPEKKLQKI